MAAKKSTTTKKTASSKGSANVKSAKTSEASSSVSPRTKKIAWIVLGVVLVLIILYLVRSMFVVATVNGQPINRMAFARELEKQAGKQALQSLVTKALIMQEARKQNVSVTPDELQTEVKKIEATVQASGQTLDQALAMEGISREQFEEQLELQKLVEKMAGANVAVTDDEVTKYMEENKDALPTTVEATETAQLKSAIKEQLQQQKVTEKMQSWLEGIQKQGQVIYFVNF